MKRRTLLKAGLPLAVAGVLLPRTVLGAYPTKAFLAEELPDAPVCLSSEVCPEMREYERFSTTTANAYVQPLMARYLTRLEVALDERGFLCRQLDHVGAVEVVGRVQHRDV